jgi:hypothetical protein
MSKNTFINSLQRVCFTFILLALSMLSSSKASQKFFLNDRIESTNACNVRATASLTGTLLFTQQSNILGTVSSGPTTNSGFVWYQIAWDNTTTTGWTADISLLLSPPDTTYPGDKTASGSTVDSLTPQFIWLSVHGATGYGLYIRDTDANVLVFPNAAGNTASPIIGTSYNLPAGFLAPGKHYKWNLNSFSGTTEYSPAPGGNPGTRFFVTGTLPAAPSSLAAVGHASSIDLSWQDNSSNEDSFQLERTGGAGTVLFGIPANTTSFSDTTASACNAYTYRLWANNGIGSSSTTGFVSDTLHKSPAAPDSIVATAGPNAITVAWRDNACDENGFRVERKTGTGGTWVNISGDLGVNTVGYSDNGSLADTVYYYRLYSFNTYGSSQYSDEVSAARITQYTIGVSAGPNGKVLPAGNVTINRGTDLDLSATPASNYVVDSWILDGVVGQAGGNTYKIPAINVNHTVLVTFKVQTFKLAIGGSLDDTQVFVDGSQVPSAALYELIFGTQVTVRKNIPSPFQFVDFWSITDQSGSRNVSGMSVTTPMLSDTVLKPTLGTMNSTPSLGGSVSQSGNPVLTVPPSGTASAEVIRHVHRSHDLVCWHDYDLDPTSPQIVVNSGPCSFGTPGNENAYFRTEFDVRVHTEPVLLFPIPGRSATSVQVTSLLDHCNADSLKEFSSLSLPNNSWYVNGVIGAYTHDEMFMTYKGEILCSGNSSVQTIDGLYHFKLNQPLLRPLDLTYAGGDLIGYSGHPGYDFDVSGLGDNVVVVACEDGTIIPSLSGYYENRIFIEHERLGIATVYLHMKKWSKEVFDHNDTSPASRQFYFAKPIAVKKGQILGLTGGAGKSQEPGTDKMVLNRFRVHLHLEMYRIVYRAGGLKYYVLMDPYGAYSETGKQAYGTSWLPSETPTTTFVSGDYLP